MKRIMTSPPVNICNEKDTRLEKGKLNTKYKFTLLPAQKIYIANGKIFINSTNPSNYRLEDLRLTFKSCREDPATTVQSQTYAFASWIFYNFYWFVVVYSLQLL